MRSTVLFKSGHREKPGKNQETRANSSTGPRWNKKCQGRRGYRIRRPGQISVQEDPLSPSTWLHWASSGTWDGGGLLADQRGPVTRTTDVAFWAFQD